jgi:hypothetical protein
LDKIIKHKNIINFARAQRLGWYGHNERMRETRMVKAIRSGETISKSPTGRPKTRWEGDVKKDIQKLKVPNWKTFAQDRRRWKEVVEKGKTVQIDIQSHYCVTATFMVQGSVPSFPLHFHTF